MLASFLTSIRCGMPWTRTRLWPQPSEVARKLSDREIRYATYLGSIKRHRRRVNYSTMLEAERVRPPLPRLRAVDLHRLLTPYVSVRLGEQLRTVVPLALLLIAFQALALRTSLLDTETVVLGILAAVAATDSAFLVVKDDTGAEVQRQSIPVSADPIEFTLGQHPQQPGL